VISIGLPAVKPEFLREAVNSVLTQEHRDLELIVVNDRNSTAIKEIIAGFEDPRIRYHEEREVLPVVGNWNRVLSYARGEYFVMFSDDDLMHPAFLSEMTLLVRSHPACRLFHCRVNKIDASGMSTGMTTICPAFESGLHFMHGRICGNREFFAPEFMVHTDSLRKAGGFHDLPLAWGSDDITWFRLAMEAGVAFSEQRLLSWRSSPVQVSVAGSVDARLLAIDLYGDWIGTFLRQSVPSNEAERELLQEILISLPGYLGQKKLFLLDLHAAHHSKIGHAAFFLRRRRSRQLKFKWLLYTLWHNR
jgi:glycosyltransferase involved in cell wall biosynthesis